jgi:N-acetyl-anhydromuramyl-L-alanine amidase AmpD
VANDFPTTGTPPMIGKVLSIPDWLNYIANYDFGKLPPARVVLHHTWRPTPEQWTGLRSMQGIQAHFARKNWNSAPHIFVAPDGIWLFTPLRNVGIHAGTGNSGRINGAFWYSIGVEMVGDYDRARPGGAIWEGTKAVLGGLSKRLGIAPKQLISFHRDYTNQKSCPGWAVTKEWVHAEIDAWLSGKQAPVTPAGPIGSPTPEAEQLGEALLEAGYSRRGEGYNNGWAFHQYAVQNGLGFPIAKSAIIDVGGKKYAFQPFARDTLYNEVPHWGDVLKLTDLLGNAIPAAGLGRALLEATYRAGGATFHADWAFHQHAVANRLGPPIGESAPLTIDGAKYNFQVFAMDTLYTPVPNWSDVRRLSALAATSKAPEVRLRDALLAQTYGRANTKYEPTWAFHQLARTWNLGAPLSDSHRISSSGAQYAIQVYATDTLYNVVPNWSEVRRLSELFAPKPATLIGKRAAPVTALLSPNACLAPAPAPFHIIRHTASHPSRTAYGSRGGVRIRMIILHGDGGPADRVLEAMTTVGARAMPHYYVTCTGAINQLVDDQFAAWHSGMATIDGQQININRLSLGVMAEYTNVGYTNKQLDALTWLIDTLRDRHDIPETAIVPWSTLDPHRDADPHPFPPELFANRLRPEMTR